MTPDPAVDALPTKRGVRRDFRWLWIGQTTSLVGDQFMTLALPLLAVLVLHTSPALAALLPFCLFVPFLFLGLPAGAILERLPRRTTMLVCNGAQFVLFGAIWVLAATGVLRFWMLAPLVLASGCAVVFFQVAYTSYLPSMIIDPDELHRANARLALSESSAHSVGPMLAGPVIKLFGVVGAIAVDALTFLGSVVCLLRIKHIEEVPEVSSRAPGWIRRDIKEGLRFVGRHPVLQPVLACGTAYALFLSMIETSLVLYCLQVLHLAPQWIGVVTGAAAAGYPIGNLLSTRLARRLGTHSALMAAATTSVLGIICMPVMGTIGGRIGVLGLVAGSILHCIGEGAYGPISLTLRQTESPVALRARIGSVQRFFMWGAVSIGSLMAAASTAVFGLAGSVWIGGLGTIIALPALYRRGMRDKIRARRHPEQAAEDWIHPEPVEAPVLAHSAD